MIGAIIGDIAGSRFEFDNYRNTDFEIFHRQSFLPMIQFAPLP